MSQVALDSLHATAAEYNQTDGTARVFVCVSVCARMCEILCVSY